MSLMSWLGLCLAPPSTSSVAWRHEAAQRGPGRSARHAQAHARCRGGPACASRPLGPLPTHPGTLGYETRRDHPTLTRWISRLMYQAAFWRSSMAGVLSLRPARHRYLTAFPTLNVMCSTTSMHSTPEGCWL